MPERFYYFAAHQAFHSLAFYDSAILRQWIGAPNAAQLFGKAAGRLLECSVTAALLQPLRWHDGRVPDGREFVAVEFPTPRPMPFTEETLSHLRPGDMEEMGFILSPYFVLWIGSWARQPEENQCFLLGQSPIAGQSTLRQLTSAGSYNRGPGPEPRLEELLQAVCRLEDFPPVAARVGPEALRTEVDRELLAQIEASG